MSHAVGEVILDGNTVAYFEYDGTNDSVLPAIWETLDEVDAHWRNQPDRQCTCKGEPTEVLIWSSYGKGFYWPGTACLECKVIVSGLAPYEQFEFGSEWPKRGYPSPIQTAGIIPGP